MPDVAEINANEAGQLLVGASKAAEILSISKRHLWSLTRDGLIPHVRLRNRVLYSPQSLRGWVASSLQGGNQ